MRISSRRLGEFLVEHRVLTRDTLDELLAREAAEGVGFAELLAREGTVSDRDLSAAVAHELGVPFIDLAEQSIGRDVWAMVPEELARKYRAVAVERRGDAVVVALDDPTDAPAADDIAGRIAARVEPAAAPRADLERLLDQMYGGESRASVGEERLRLDDLLRDVLAAGASDLHLTVGVPPTMRVRGAMEQMAGAPALTGSEVRRLVLGALTQRQRERLLADGEVQSAHGIPGTGRFRVSAFVQRNSVGAVFRLVPDHVPSPAELGLPDEVVRLAEETRGLVLVCGRSGSGTSTTVAALVDLVNRSRACHVLTIEDPIEFLHRHQRAIVNQREVGEDTAGFAVGLRHALRQDADVLVLGDLPDAETMRLAVNAAETGHLVIGVVRSVDTSQALERVVDAFPAEQRPQARMQLAGSFRGAVAQRLVPRLDGGMAIAIELLLPSGPVVNLLRSGDLASLRNTIVGGTGSGMMVLDQSLASLVQSGEVTADAALEQAVDPDELRYLLSGSSSH
jgi:twitching motility protein PilT